MTMSIAGLCRRTGSLGAVIASSSPAVASRCVWIAPRLGVVLTQNITDPAIGQRGLELLATSLPAENTIPPLLRALRRALGARAGSPRCR